MENPRAMMTDDLMGMAKEDDHREPEEGVGDGDRKSPQCLNESEPKSASAVAGLSRKERRKASKKEKRKQKRKEDAEKAREEEKARLNDPEEQRRIQLEEEREKERLEIERREFEEKERLFVEALARRKALEEEEEEERRRSEEAAEKLNDNKVEVEIAANEDDEWEYIEEGPPQIIWRGNEIIVKKTKVRVKKKDVDQHIGKEDPDRPTSNPLLPQSQAFADFKNGSMISAQELLENVAQQVPNFGTEQDKAHCPFHLKTGACRFGTRCSRVHFYPDKSCTLLIKNMYNGPGLAWEQDEGLEYTDEEVDRSYEEFYEDVHTEFLKFGEIVNFKVCRNGSNHLRGNVYVHYVSLDAAVLACHAINGRYFAGKQVSCEFVNLTKWRVAICGEFMKSKLKTCSRGTACNFIHCFRNPGGDYEWADWDKPAPKYWAKKMAALFGYSNESGYEKWSEEESPRQHGNSSKRLTTSSERYHCRRSQSIDTKSSNKSSRDHYKKDESRSNKYRKRLIIDDATRPEFLDERRYEEKRYSISRRHDKNRRRQYDSESERECLDAYQDADGFHDQTRKTSRCRNYGRSESFDGGKTWRNRSHDYISDSDLAGKGIEREKHHEYSKKKSKKEKVLSGSGDNDDCSTKERYYYSTDSIREQSYDSRNALSSKDHLHRKRRKYSSDSGGDSSDGIRETSHGQRKKSRTHRNEVSGLSHWDTGNSLNKKHNVRESEHAKPNLQTGQTQNTSDKGQHSSRKNAKLNHPDGESIDAGGRWKPDNVDERETRKRRRKSHGNSGSEHSKESRSSKQRTEE